MRCGQIRIAYLGGVYLAGVSSIGTCFRQVSVLVNPLRRGIALICSRPVYILCFSAILSQISHAVKRINPRIPIEIKIRALIATE